MLSSEEILVRLTVPLPLARLALARSTRLFSEGLGLEDPKHMMMCVIESWRCVVEKVTQ